MSVALTLLAAEKAAPLIDIDGTVFLQFGIFLVMAGVLYSFVFRPYFKVRDAREAGIGGARKEAKAMEEKAAAISIDYEERLTKAKVKGVEERNKLREEGKAHEVEVLGKAQKAAHDEIAKTREIARAEQDKARQSLLADAPTVGKSLASKILGRSL